MAHFDAANHSISTVTAGTPDSWTLAAVSGWLGLANYIGSGTRIVECRAASPYGGVAALAAFVVRAIGRPLPAPTRPAGVRRTA